MSTVGHSAVNGLRDGLRRPLDDDQKPMRVAVDKDGVPGRVVPLAEIGIIDVQHSHIAPRQIVRDDDRALSLD